MEPQLIGFAAVLAVLAGGTVRYWQLLDERRHYRRAQERLDAVRHLAAVVRAQFAERRRIA